MRDLRRAPFCWQSCAATSAIREHWTGKRRTTALAMYQALTEIANEERTDQFVRTQKLVAERAGLSVRTVREYAQGFATLNLLRVHRRQGEAGAELAPEWELVDPPAANAAPPAADDVETSHPPAANADLSSSQEPSNTKRDTKDAQEVDRLCELFAERVSQRTQRAKPYTVTDRWRTEMRRLIEIDGREPVEVERAIEWVHAHPFWAGVVLSVPKFRAKYDTLRLQAEREGRGSGRAGRNGYSVGPTPDDLRRRAAELRKAGQ